MTSMFLALLAAPSLGQQPVPNGTIPLPPPVAPAPAPAPPGSDLNRAKELLDDGKVASAQAAIPILQGVLQQTPDLPAAQLDLGVALQRTGDLNGAMAQYQKVKQADPSNGDAWTNIAYLQQQMGRPQDAEQTLRQGIQQCPNHMPLRVALIDLLRSQKRTQEAIDTAKAALKVDTRAFEVYDSLGLAYLDTGETMLARFVFQEALRDADGDGKSDLPGADSNAYLHCNLGRAFFLQGDPYTAETELKKAVDLDPELVPALVYLSELYLERHDYEDTLPLLERASQIAPTNHGVIMNLGLVYRGLNRLPDAKAAYQKALELDPHDPDPHFNLAVVIGDYEKNYDAGVNEFQAYIQGGGTERALAEENIAALQKEQKQQDTKKKAEEAKKKREEDRKKRDEAEKAAKDAAQQAPAPAPDGGTPEPTPAPPTPAPEPSPAPEPAPAPENPWGGPQ